MLKLAILLVAGVFFSGLWTAERDTANSGRELLEKRCGGCHSLDSNKVGPSLRTVYGRRSAVDPRFPYSDGLKNARLTWDEPTLDRWLADPEALVSGTEMAFRVTRADERSAIIAYLKQLAAKPGEH